ncbi:HU family DNA-binding protein [Tannerella sp.]|uniref:HU family DNA-binding protein n=1 Tax=Tannerella sp. TaxID=2382127 RepID=UPI0026DB233D|nr:HU family DNA-binding protein [Tannerella sp.]MDO4704478.1 DNA-binding domain-containing protein [Tannerella sp.]
MSVKYIITEKGNPSKPAEPKKFYATAKADGEVTFRKLSKEISNISTTVSDTDVLAVLNVLVKALINHLSEGRIVRFGEFGSFQVSLSSEGAVTRKEFNASLIRNSKITFRPGTNLKEMLATLKYEKYEK